MTAAISFIIAIQGVALGLLVPPAPANTCTMTEPVRLRNSRTFEAAQRMAELVPAAAGWVYNEAEAGADRPVERSTAHERCEELGPHGP